MYDDFYQLKSIFLLLMKCISFILLLIIICQPFANAQRKLKQLDEEKQEENDKYKNRSRDDWKDKFVFGGNIGGSFGSNFSFFLAQPMVGYRVKEKTLVGVGATYIYSHWKYISPPISQSTSV